VCYNINMKAFAGLPESNEKQAESNDQSKRTTKGQSRPNDNLYARLRRFEQRIERLESAVSTLRRDAYRIEKRQQRAEQAPSPVPAPGIPPELQRLFE